MKFYSAWLVLATLAHSRVIRKFGRWEEDYSNILGVHEEIGECLYGGKVSEVVRTLSETSKISLQETFKNLTLQERVELFKEFVAQKFGIPLSQMESKFLNESRIQIIQHKFGSAAAKFMEALQSFPCLSVESDRKLNVSVEDDGVSVEEVEETEAPDRQANGYNPNDSLWGDQWYLKSSNQFSIMADLTWNTYTASSPSTPINVAVLDTGCSLHPDLIDQFYVANSSSCDINNVTQSGNKECFGWDFVDRDGNPFDEGKDAVHGTPVSGAIAGRQNNGFGTAGVCWGCKIVCLRILDNNGEATLSRIVTAYEWLIKNSDFIRISNHSYGGYGPESAAIKTAISELRNRGHLLIAAAGNESCNIDQRTIGKNDLCQDESGQPLGVMSPGGLSMDNIMTVGAVNKHGEAASFSNWGLRSVDLFAPGEDLNLIYNTRWNSRGSKNMSGTSFSAPVVTGAAALLWASSPSLTYQQIKDILMTTTQPLNSLTGSSVTNGILDLEKAHTQSGSSKDSPRATEIAKADLTDTAYATTADNSANRPFGTSILALLLPLLPLIC